MTFQHFTVFRLVSDEQLPSSVGDKLANFPFRPIDASESSTSGWVPPNSQAPDLYDLEIDGAWRIELMVESKILPASVVRECLDKRIKEMEERSGQKVGKKEKADIKDAIVQELLSIAFSKRKSIQGLLDRRTRSLYVNTLSRSQAELFVSKLREALGALSLRPLATKFTPVNCMTSWLNGELPEELTIDGNCTMKSSDDSTVTCRKQNLTIQEIVSLIATGKEITRLAVTHIDGYTVEINEQCQIGKLAYTDLSEQGDVDDEVDSLKTETMLALGAARKLVPYFCDAFGGEKID